jgi:hypothetical protein
MTQLARVMERLASVKRVLASLDGSPHLARHSTSQGEALKSMIQGLALTDDDVAKLNEAIYAARLPAEIESSLVGAASVQRQGKNVQLQQYEHFTSYILASTWRSMENERPHNVMAILITFLISIGLRHPSCPTYRILTALFAVITQGEESAASLTKEEKYNLVKNLKAEFHRRAMYTSAAPAMVHVLPPQASMFLEDFPVYAPVYKDELPTNCPLMDQELLLALAESFPLRKPTSGLHGVYREQRIAQSFSVPDADKFSMV